MWQTLEDTNCWGFGLDIATYHDAIYLAVTCVTTQVTHIFRRGTYDRNFTVVQVSSLRGRLG